MEGSGFQKPSSRLLLANGIDRGLGSSAVGVLVRLGSGRGAGCRDRTPGKCTSAQARWPVPAFHPSQGVWPSGPIRRPARPRSAKSAGLPRLNCCIRRGPALKQSVSQDSAAAAQQRAATTWTDLTSSARRSRPQAAAKQHLEAATAHLTHPHCTHHHHHHHLASPPFHLPSNLFPHAQ